MIDKPKWIPNAESECIYASQYIYIRVCASSNNYASFIHRNSFLLLRYARQPRQTSH